MVADDLGYTDLGEEDEPKPPLEAAIMTWEQIGEDDDFDEPIH